MLLTFIFAKSITKNPEKGISCRGGDKNMLHDKRKHNFVLECTGIYNLQSYLVSIVIIDPKLNFSK